MKTYSSQPFVQGHSLHLCSHGQEIKATSRRWMNSEHASAGRRLLGVRYTDPKMFAEGRKEARHRGGSAGPRFWEPGAGCAWEQVSTAGLVLDGTPGIKSP
jgi:hypothetical protein